MRLLDTHTLQLIDLFGAQERPEYVVLSHTWGDDEISYREMISGISYNELQRREGGRKILAFCHRAAYHGYRLCWIDTCCIDKSSSQEISESINSMFRWYTDASACWAYLSDVEPVPVTDYLTANMNINDRYRESFLASRWHTRGWTLQELLAPKAVFFLDKYWFKFGCKNSLSSLLTIRTTIAKKFLEVPGCATVAQRLSWAAHRETTRPEDAFYCLIGLLEVNMHTLYGEGYDRAFRRLQKHLYEDSEDPTILAWTNPNTQYPSDRGVASDPSYFESCTNVFVIGPVGNEAFLLDKRGVLMTEFKGIYLDKLEPAYTKFQPRLEELRLPLDKRILVLPLNCQCGPTEQEMSQLCLVLLELYDASYTRIGCVKLRAPLEADSLSIIPRFHILEAGYQGPDWHYATRTDSALGLVTTDNLYDFWDR